MTQSDKDLLLKDLCARVPYGIKVEYENKVFDLEYVCPMYEEVKLDIYQAWTIGVSEVKPYLFPMSSMTEEQSIEYGKLCERYCPASIYSMEMIDWFNKNHFDYRGLITMGLANDATGKNIY